MKVTRRPGETVDSLIQRYKRKRAADGISDSIKKHRHYVKPGDRRRQKQRAALERLQRARKRRARTR